MWRHADLLGIDPTHATTLGEGGTPLLPSRSEPGEEAGRASVSFKAEHQNPTGSFKDRIAAMAAAIVARDGLKGAIGTSSGNGGAAIAAYGARAGFPVELFTVAGIVAGKLRQILAHGATTNIVAELGTAFDGIEGVAHSIAELARDEGWLAFLTGGRFAPEAMRGAETIAYELHEQRPTATDLYVPIGGGGLLASIWRGYRRLGITPPRLIGVQPRGCPTLGRALAGVTAPLEQPLTTTISGLQVPVLFDADTAKAVRESGGRLVEVTDEQAWAAQRLLARDEGLYVEPAGATAYAGLLADGSASQNGDDIVVLLSGAGHKDDTAAQRLGADNPARHIGADDLPDVLRQRKGTS